MALTQQTHVQERSTRRSAAWSLAVVGVLAGVVVAIVMDGGDAPSTSSTRGSGVSVTEHREVAPFATVELAGTNAVAIRVGAPLSVEVTGDDNLVGRVTTQVRDGRLVVNDTGSFTAKASMHVAISTPSLDGVELSGDGALTVDGVTSADFSALLAGDGTLVVSGTAQRVTAVLGGDGTLDLHDLVSIDSSAQLRGTGTIRVSATGTLDATLTGTGSILYGGEPTVTMHNTGTGAVVPE